MDSYIVLDLETTGFSPETDDIIEIGAYKVKDNVVVDKFCTFVRPIVYIPRNVQQITHITMNDVKDSDPIEPVIIDFFEFCEDCPFLGHNLQFDFSFLETKGKRVGLDFTRKHSRFGTCTLKLARKYLNLKSNKLGDVAEYFEINIPVSDNSGLDYHRAGYDAIVTKAIYERLKLLYPNALDIKMPEMLGKDDSKYGKVVCKDELPLF